MSGYIGVSPCPAGAIKGAYRRDGLPSVRLSYSVSTIFCTRGQKGFDE